MVKFTDYLNEEQIIFLTAKTRDEALRQLIENLAANGKLNNPKAFYQAILEREGVISTGIGMGIAIPHAKLPEYDNFFIAIGILEKGLDWQSLDDIPVRLIVMIGGPDDRQTQYLKILSELTLFLRDKKRRKKLLTYTSSKKILKFFKSE